MFNALFAAASAVALLAPAPGAPGIGDPYYPGYGNGGYRVAHYDIGVRYFPDSGRLTGTTTIKARATQDLSRFDLDFMLATKSVTVDGRPAAFTRDGLHELVVTPDRPLYRGHSMTVVVQYDDVPSKVFLDGYDFSFFLKTADGALAVNEPEMAQWWFPSNDHPSDKASFDIAIDVPSGLQALSNGRPVGRPTPSESGWTRWHWRERTPMETCLAFLAIGHYDIVTGRTSSGLPVVSAYSTLLPPAQSSAARASIGRTAEIAAWESSMFGAYPQDALGGVAAPPDLSGGAGAPDTIPFALETQTRPVYGPGFFNSGANPTVIAHEIAHQWFGDSVSIDDWSDIWLNEGFARYTEWLWSEHEGTRSAQRLADDVYAAHPADDPFWTIPPGAPGSADNEFADAVYDRGALTLQQLRNAVGDRTFFRILRTWATVHAHGNANIQQFIALADHVSGKSLNNLLDTWLFTPARPPLTTPPARSRAATTTPNPSSAPAVAPWTAA